MKSHNFFFQILTRCKNNIPKMHDPILDLPFHSQSSRENATPSSGTSPIAYYTEVPFPGYQHLISYVLTSLQKTHNVPVTIKLAARRTFRIRTLVIIGFFTFRGGLFMTSRSTGSTPRLQKRTWTTDKCDAVSLPPSLVEI